MDPTIVQSQPAITQPTSAANPTLPDTVVGEKAGFVFRGAAAVVDQILLSICGFVLGFAGGILQISINPMIMVISVVSVLYYWLSTGLAGATIGKKLFKLQVVTKEGQPSLGKAFLRETIGKIFSSLPLSLGYFWVIWDKDKQAWHDKISGTYVVQTETIGGGRKFLAYALVLVVPIFMILGLVGAVILLSINPQEQIEKARQMQLQQNALP